MPTVHRSSSRSRRRSRRCSRLTWAAATSITRGAASSPASGSCRPRATLFLRWASHRTRAFYVRQYRDMKGGLDILATLDKTKPGQRRAPRGPHPGAGPCAGRRPRRDRRLPRKVRRVRRGNREVLGRVRGSEREGLRRPQGRRSLGEDPSAGRYLTGHGPTCSIVARRDVLSTAAEGRLPRPRQRIKEARPEDVLVERVVDRAVVVGSRRDRPSRMKYDEILPVHR